MAILGTTRNTSVGAAGTSKATAAAQTPLESLKAKLASAEAKLATATSDWSPAGSSSRRELRAQRDGLAAELSKLTGAPQGAVAQQAKAPTPGVAATPRAPDPKAVTESRIMAQMRALPKPYNGDGDPKRLGHELYERTVGRIGTDESFVNRALELAHTKGNLAEVNAALGEKMRAADPRVADRPEIKANPNDGYLRLMIKSELSGSEALRATDYLETGADQYRATTGSLLAEGLLDNLDRLGDGLHDKPVQTAAKIAGTVAVGVAAVVAAPELALGAGIGMLAVTAGKALKNTYEAVTATTPKDRAANLVELGQSFTPRSTRDDALPSDAPAKKRSR